jgi:hypothetical protein
VKGTYQIAMAKVDGLMVQWIVRGYRTQIDKIFGGLDLEVLLVCCNSINRK